MTNSTPSGYHLPDLLIGNSPIVEEPVCKLPDAKEIDNVDKLLAQELLSDLLLTPTSKRQVCS